MSLDVKQFLNKEKLDVEFVKNLHAGNNVGTIISSRLVTINDPKEGPKEVIELGVDFASLGLKKTCLANQTTLIKLSEGFESFDAESWVGKQVIPSIEIWKNNRAGVVLDPVIKKENNVGVVQ